MTQEAFNLSGDLRAFRYYLEAERGMSKNTVLAYQRDLRRFQEWSLNGTLADYLQPTLRETVSHNCARIREAASKGLPYVVSHYPELAAQSRPQSGGRTYTTPSFWQFLRIWWQHRKLYRQSLAATANRNLSHSDNP